MSSLKTKQQLEQSIRRSRQAVLIVNAHSRRGQELLKVAKDMLGERGIILTQTHVIKNPKYIGRVVQKALESKPELIIVGSGDGTVAEIVDHLAYCNTVVGFIPLGTTNNFARSLDIPLDIEGAIDTIATGKVADIDLGDIDGDYFANVASIGISVDVARAVTRKLKKRFGRLAYAIAGLKVLLTHKSFRVIVDTEEKRHEFWTHQVIIANGRFHAGSVIATDASIDSHELVIFHLGDTRKWQLLRSLLLLAMNRPRTLEEGNFIITKKARLETLPKRPVEMDGEDKAETPIDISLAPNALKMIVPQTFLDD